MSEIKLKEAKLVDAETGNKAVYDTVFTATEEENKYVFTYMCSNCLYHTPYTAYNDKHYLGDVCELFIGKREGYYEIEVSPNGSVFFAELQFDLAKGTRKATYLDKSLCDKYLCTEATHTEKGYQVVIEIDKALFTDYEEIFYNAYRIETDGGTAEKYLFALFPTSCRSFHTPSSFQKLK